MERATCRGIGLVLPRGKRVDRTYVARTPNKDAQNTVKGRTLGFSAQLWMLQTIDPYNGMVLPHMRVCASFRPLSASPVQWPSLSDNDGQNRRPPKLAALMAATNDAANPAVTISGREEPNPSPRSVFPARVGIGSKHASEGESPTPTKGRLSKHTKRKQNEPSRQKANVHTEGKEGKGGGASEEAESKTVHQGVGGAGLTHQTLETDEDSARK